MMRIHFCWLLFIWLCGLGASFAFSHVLVGALETCHHNGVSDDQTAADGSMPPGIIRTLTSPAFRHRVSVTELAVLDGGKRILSANWQEGAILWDAAKGTRLKKLAERVSMGMAVSPAEDMLAVRSGDRVVTVYSLPSNKLQFTFEVENPLALAFSPDGKTLATGGSSAHEILLWDTATGKSVGALKGHENVVFGLAFHPDGQRMFSIGMDGTLRRWDLASRKETGRLTEPPGWYGYSIALSGDGGTLAMEVGTGTGFVPDKYQSHVRLLDTATLKERFRAVLSAAKSQDVALSPSGRYVAVAFELAKPEDRFLRLWDSSTGRQISLDPGNAKPISRVRFFPDGKTLASAGGDGVVRLWNVADGVEHALTKGPGASPVKAVAFAPSGDVLASVTEDGPVRLWDTTQGVALKEVEKAAASIGGLVFSPDGTLLLCTPAQFGVTAANLWNVRTGERLRTIQPIRADAAFSPNGKILAAQDDEYNIRLWDVATGGELRRLGAGAALGQPVFSADNRLLATAASNGILTPFNPPPFPGANYNATVHLWNVANGTAIRTLTLSETRLQRIWFSPDGLLLFVYCRSGNPDTDTLEVFDTAAGESVLNAKVGVVSPRGLWSTPKGMTVTVVSAAGKFSAFDMVTGAPLGGEVAYGGDFTAADFTPDRKMLALGYGDGRVILWEPPPLPARKPLSLEIDERKLRELWAALADTDATRAYQARWQLAGAPKAAMPVLRRELRPVAPVEAKQVLAWIVQLDGSTFKERELAMRQLEKVGNAFEPALVKVLEGNPTLEMRRRVELLLAKIAAPPTGDLLRSLRAIAVLEAIGGDEARVILRGLAEGAPESRITEAAQGALSRIR